MHYSNRTKGLIYGGLTAVLFALYALINKYVYVTYNPDSVAYTATFLTCAAFFAIAAFPFTAKPKPIKGSWLIKTIGAGILAGIAIGVLVIGQKYTTAINAGIISPTSVLFTIIFAAIILKEKFPKNDYVWGFVLFIGVYLAVAGFKAIDFNSGDILVLAAALLLGLVNVAAKLVMLKDKSNFVADIRVLSGGLFAALFGFVLVGDFFVTSAGLWPLVGGFAFWLAIRSFYAAIHYVGPTSGIITATAYPVLITLGAYFWLGEGYSISKFIGSVLIIGSIVMLNLPTVGKTRQFTKR